MKVYRSVSYRIATWIIHGCVWLSIVFLIIFWNRIPAEIPTHYNAAGVANGWGGKGMLLLLIIIMFFIYGCHFIGMLFMKNSTTAEGLYSKKLKDFVTEEDMQSGLRLSMEYLAWTDATVLLMFVYIIICSASCRSMGAWFIWSLIGVITLELVWYMVCLGKRKKLIRLRAMEQTLGKEDREEKTAGDADGGYEEPTYDDVTGSLGTRTMGDIRRAPEEKTYGDISGKYEKEKVDDM